LFANWYGKGSDIWPPTNVDAPVRLEDSFPGRKIPHLVEAVTVDSAAYSETTTVKTPPSVRWKSWVGLTFCLVAKGVVGPMDIGAVLLWTMYIYLLIHFNSIPTVPPAGHIPALVRNPLQQHIRRKDNFTGMIVNWDTCFGFVLPFLFLVGQTTPLSVSWWRRAALGQTTLWWMVTEVADEMLATRNKHYKNKELIPFQSTFFPLQHPLPLPIQYWIRISSRLVRWVFLTVAVVVTQWPSIAIHTAGGTAGAVNTATNFTVLPYLYRLLPFLQWMVATVQIFGFWIPVAGMQYMRAHLIAAEAESLTIQPTVRHYYSPYLSPS
jgi:hypothetical protein